ncbi:uncharacterized protein AB675_8367 [Cyphellophora attinorum]|uniref:Uncharacterized protein n=1 Tax=Cyphellophora attinorum TaxID=1664694 RepID=A0A0N0NR74_9EURO|nr:uncharacterized protein AB675_8367 [Phialophora attinorum]KPI44499.1 hypothetical protein AB675_8367 [Phialophora attinorum]
MPSAMGQGKVGPSFAERAGSRAPLVYFSDDYSESLPVSQSTGGSPDIPTQTEAFQMVHRSDAVKYSASKRRSLGIAKTAAPLLSMITNTRNPAGDGGDRDINRSDDAARSALSARRHDSAIDVSYEPVSPIESRYNVPIGRDDGSISPVSSMFPTEGPRRSYYPPSSYRMNEKEEPLPIPKPGSPISEQERARLLGEAEKLRRESKPRHSTIKLTKPAKPEPLVVPELAHLRASKGDSKKAVKSQGHKTRDHSVAYVPKSPAAAAVLVTDVARHRSSRIQVEYAESVTTLIPSRDDYAVHPNEQGAAAPPVTKRRRASLKDIGQKVLQGAQKVVQGAQQASQTVSKHTRRVSRDFKLLRNSIAVTPSNRRQSTFLDPEQLKPKEARIKANRLSAPLNSSPLRPIPVRQTTFERVCIPRVSNPVKPVPTRQPTLKDTSASAIAACLPPANEVYNSMATHYFTDCSHNTSMPGITLPIFPPPNVVVLQDDTLRYPTLEHQQHLKSQRDHVDLKPHSVSLIEGRCAGCHYLLCRTLETIILDEFNASVGPDSEMGTALAELQKAPTLDGIARPSLRGRSAGAKSLEASIAEVTVQRDLDVKKVWKGFSAAWGPRCWGIIGTDVDAPTASEVYETATRADFTRTGYGYMRTGEHGRPIGDLVHEDGRMKLDWLER